MLINALEASATQCGVLWPGELSNPSRSHQQGDWQKSLFPSPITQLRIAESSTFPKAIHSFSKYCLACKEDRTLLSVRLPLRYWVRTSHHPFSQPHRPARNKKLFQWAQTLKGCSRLDKDPAEALKLPLAIAFLANGVPPTPLQSKGGGEDILPVIFVFGNVKLRCVRHLFSWK